MLPAQCTLAHQESVCQDVLLLWSIGIVLYRRHRSPRRHRLREQTFCSRLL
jgi:hypothetical protein